MSDIIMPELRHFDSEKRHLIGPVVIPQRFDQHGDGFTVNEVEFSCHYYNRNHYGSCDINHVLDVDCCRIIESYILEVETEINGVTLPAGTWMAKMEVDKTYTGDVIWDMLKEGTLQGFSPKGFMQENKIVEEQDDY
jgi:hypothetical protein